MGMMEKLGVDEDTPIEQKMLTNAIENAQKQVESRNFQTRKNVLQYDDVMNTQREVIYKERRKVLDGEDLQDSIQNMLHNTVENAIRGHMGEQKHMTAEQFQEATALFHTMFLRPGELALTDEELQQYDEEQLVQLVMGKAREVYEAREKEFGSPLMRELERVLMLRVVDEYWMDQIDAMNDLKQGIETLRRLFLVRVRQNQEVKRERVAKVTGESGASDGSVQQRPQRKVIKIGRNDPCPCGSGLTWKKGTCKQFHPEVKA